MCVCVREREHAREREINRRETQNRNISAAKRSEEEINEVDSKPN